MTKLLQVTTLQLGKLFIKQNNLLTTKQYYPTASRNLRGAFFVGVCKFLGKTFGFLLT